MRIGKRPIRNIIQSKIEFASGRTLGGTPPSEERCVPRMSGAPNRPYKMNENMKKVKQKISALSGAILLLFTAAGCHVDMWRQPKVKPQAPSDFFADGASSRLPVAKTVVHGELKEDEGYSTGYIANKPLDTIPARALASFPGATDAERTTLMLHRGQNRYNIFCTPCHGKLGDGNGMIAQRGFTLRRPPGNYHTDRLRQMPIGHFYDVISNAYGSMYSYASRIPDVNDRWAICAYIRVLQLSQNAKIEDVKPEDRDKLNAAPAVAPTGSEMKEK